MQFMKKYLLMVCMFAGVAAFAAVNETWTGYISDAHCGVKEDQAGHASCAKNCIKGGADPVLVVGDKVYKFADPKKAVKFAGEKVSVTGKLEGDAITVEKISKAK